MKLAFILGLFCLASEVDSNVIHLDVGYESISEMPFEPVIKRPDAVQAPILGVCLARAV